MKKIYESPIMTVVKLHHSSRLMIGSGGGLPPVNPGCSDDYEEPGEQPTGPDEDVPGL